VASLLKSNFASDKDTLSGIKQGKVVRNFPKQVTECIDSLWSDDSPPSREQIIGVASEYLNGQSDLDTGAVLDRLDSYISAIDLNDPEAKSATVSFVRGMALADLYQDIYQIWKSKEVLDKQDIYLYYFHIKYGDDSYPLFYVPVTLSREAGGVFQFEYDPRVFLNTRAIQYIAEKYAEATNTNTRISLPNRQIYRGGLSVDELLEKLQETLNEVTDFFGLNPIDLSLGIFEPQENAHVKIVGDVNIALFDKSDEALLNDYEQLLQLLGEDDDALSVGLLEQLSNAFLLENPENFSNEVDEHYNNLDSGERLSYVSPIPLNEEQQKVMTALRKDGCDRVIIDGPPGTGKSHTITALIYNALLNNQSVLMVSDTREALDVVEKEITKVLDKMRLDDFIQNPILRLGVKDSNYHKIFSQANYQKIKTRYNAYHRHRHEHEKKIKSAKADISSGVLEEIQNQKGVDQKQITWLIQAESFVRDHWGKSVDVDELLEAESADEIVLHLHDELKKYAAYKDQISSFSKYVNIDDFVSSETNIADVEALASKTDRLNELVTILGSDAGKFTEASASVSGSSFPETDFQEAQKIFYEIAEQIGGQEATWKKFVRTDIDPDQLLPLYDESCHIADALNKVKALVSQRFTDGQSLYCAEDINPQKLDSLEQLIVELKESKRPIVGYLLKGKKLTEFDDQFQKLFPLSSLERPHKHLGELEAEIAFYRYGFEVLPSLESLEFINKKSLGWDELYNLSAGQELETFINLLNGLQERVAGLRNTLAKVEGHPFVQAVGVQIGESKTISYSTLVKISAANEFIRLTSEIRSKTESLNLQSFIESKKEPLNYHLDTKTNSGLREKFQEFGNLLKILKESEESIKFIRQSVLAIPRSATKLGIEINDYASLSKNKLVSEEEKNVQLLSNYLRNEREVSQALALIGGYNFREGREQLQNLLTAKMSSILDEKVIEFRERYANDAQQLKKIIRGKQQIPREYLEKLVRAFPCLIVGIRELGDYIPLEPGIFDLVIIDEASQVSIAQAFPAILRGKKVVVLGDPKQYSNVKSAHASAAVNNQLFSAVRESYDKAISELPAGKQEILKDKIDRFTIKNSILDFLRNIVNYEALLKKHFRGYPEIIGYSNDRFYQGALQVMKIRGKPISEVIQFHPVKPDDKQEIIENTNEAEIDYIFDQLIQLKDQGYEGTVGIITPFRNQQARLAERFYGSDQWSAFDERFKLKIMTFDTCQGEQRDIVYYSMVEKPEQNTLRYIFPVNLQRIEDEDDGNLKAQRLNVGLSRAAESVRFVISKEVSEIKGEVGKALQWYSQELQSATNEPSAEECDSEAEKLLLSLIKQTPFYKEERENIEIKTQFELGKYLRQLNPSIDIPAYRVDFLMTYLRPNKSAKTVVIEYDGYEYHFKEGGAITEWNIDDHYIDEDVERQKALESYGYDFVRFNKFSLRGDAITGVDKKLREVFLGEQQTHAPLPDLYDSYINLQTGELRQCPECMEILEKKEFYDKSLPTKYGKKCMQCKGRHLVSAPVRRTKSKPAVSFEEFSSVTCPRCNSAMVLRKGPYGQFLGCSRFPRCRGTRKVK